MKLTRDQLTETFTKVGSYGLVSSGVFDEVMDVAENAIAIAPDQVFESAIQRDEYYTANPSKKVNGTSCSTAGIIERWDEVTSTFIALTSTTAGGDYSTEIAALQAKDVELEQRVVTLEEAGTNPVDYGPQITALQGKDVQQDGRLNSLEGSMVNKATLVSGKIPYEQLPEFPVGRKVNVANRAARLALPVYADLTIAYESDTADAWGLDANADPAIDANWSKLGSAQGIGVASFNGRTGNIGPMTGDYDAGKISELVDKRFVSTAQITAWDVKETTTGAQTKATTAKTEAQAAAKTYADSTFVPLSQKATANGVASLDSTGKVPVAQLKTNTASGVPLLDATGKLLTSQLPTNLPTAQRIWRDVKGSRTVDAYTTHTGGNGNEMKVYVRSMSSTLTTRHIVAIVRQSSTSPIFLFRSDAYGAAGDRWQHLYLNVPHGWQYSIRSDGGSTTANIEYWYEMW